MSCTNCGSKSCSCSDNCPNKTSDITVFDGQLNVLEVPCGASLNDILALLEAYTTNMVNELSEMVSVVITTPNPIGLAAGTYSIQQVINAILTALTNIEGDITTLSQQQVYVDVTKTGVNVLLATPSGGIAPYTYQWFIQDSRAQITISGSSTSASVTLAPTIATSDALVKVRITDANGRRANDCYYLRITT
jgi:hypothetical protein